MLLAREERNWIFPSPSKINGGPVKKKKKVLCLSSREGRTVAVSNSDLGGGVEEMVVKSGVLPSCRVMD
jgi:hypothetical protein